MTAEPGLEILLTEVEHRVIQELGALYDSIVTEILGPGGNTKNIENDAGEIATAIHDIQSRIMANAAARAYPHLYRLQGRVRKGS